MSGSSKVEWTDATWQPTTGCSAQCRYCYARGFARRLQAQGHPRYANGFAPTFHANALSEPLRWRKPRRCFVCSMADLFDPAITDEQIAAVFGVMATCSRHTFQVLTKRPARMRDVLEWIEMDGTRPGVGGIQDTLGAAWVDQYDIDDPNYDAKALPCLQLAHRKPALQWPMRNVWLGTTVEHRAALHRVDDLRQCPAALRFISFEPLQEQIGDIDLTGIGWVIIGADSTRGAPEMPKAWVREIRDQCIAKLVPVFYKARVENGKRVSLPKLDGRQWIQFPEVRS